LRVVIGEDEALLRQGLVLVLRDAGIEVAAVASDAPALIRQATAHDLDLVISDIRMPPGNTDDGLRAALAIRAQKPTMPIMILSQYVNRRYALELIGEDAAGVGYLLKQRVADSESFCRAVRRVADGDTVLDPEVISAMVARARSHHDAVDQLTPRQMKVLQLLAEGRSNSAIARRLVITEKAVVQHVSHIYDQLRLAPNEDDHRRVLAVIRYLAR
jgi:DNA-binding NarL/FixJ family response regulator